MAYHTRDSENPQIFIKHIDNHTYIPDFSQKIFLCTILYKRLNTAFKQEIYWIIGYFFLRGRECQQYVKEEEIIFRKNSKKYRKHFNNFMKIVTYSTMDNLEVKVRFSIFKNCWCS